MLPRYCPELMAVFFFAAIAINLARDLAPQRVARLLPSPMGMVSDPYLTGANVVTSAGMP